MYKEFLKRVKKICKAEFSKCAKSVTELVQKVLGESFNEYLAKL